MLLEKVEQGDHRLGRDQDDYRRPTDLAEKLESSPRNLNPDMTGLKETYWSGEESHLGNTGQVRMEVNAVTAPVMSAPIIYASASQTPTQNSTGHQRLEGYPQHFGNCYACKKPGHVKRDCPNQTMPGRAITEDRRKSLAVIIAIKEGIWPETAVYLRK